METKIAVRDLSFFYGNSQILKAINLDVIKNEILSIIGPANSGKTTFLKIINRLCDLDHHSRLTGQVLLDGVDISKLDVTTLRKRVGMIFALPVPLPSSIFSNIAYGPRLAGNRRKKDLRTVVERSLKLAILWDEVKDRLKEPATKLSGGQQQRLCIARTLATEPEVLLMDEPCSGLDPLSTAKIEDALLKLKKDYTIVFVTNNTKQAARVADKVAFFLSGELVEYGTPEQIFTKPEDRRTDDYIAGRFG
jgi:phosphate transport system ATP-binding protein